MQDKTALLRSLAFDRTETPVARTSRLPWYTWLAVALGTMVAGLGLAWFVLSVSAPGSAPVQLQRTEAPAPAPASAAPAEPSLGSFVASGYVVAHRKASIGSEIPGKVVALLVDEGDIVEEGQILARLDNTLARTDVDIFEAKVLQFAGGVAATATDLGDAERILSRTQTLIAKNFATEADLTKNDARAGVLRAQLNQAKAQYESARLDAKRAADVLAKHQIRAPFRGVVIERSAQPGEMISPNSAGGSYTRTGICTIVDMDSIEVEVDVNEAFIGRVHSGGAVTAVLDAYPDWTIPASVIAIVPTANRDKATVKVRVGFKGKDPRILPDMGIKVTFLGNDGLARASTGSAAGAN
jgi:RND family efflux transporter MFP subunit